MNSAAHVLAFVLGTAGVAAVFLSAIQTVVVPRGVPVTLTRLVFTGMRAVFGLRSRFVDTYEERDRAMALYAPLALITLPVVWLTLVMLSYTGIFWGLGGHSLRDAFVISGSSLFTLGFAAARDLPSEVVAFTEALAGLILLALLITYLPSMYAAFSRRETQVAIVAIFAGQPPSATELIGRFWRLADIHRLDDQLWEPWTAWFVEVDETHTSLSALPFFRSPQPDRSWITAAGVVLDAAALLSSTVENPRSPAAELCIRSGYIALRDIAAFFGIAFDPDPAPDDPICITRDEWEAVCVRLAESGVPLREDREAAWNAFRGWRVNYDTVLVALAALTMAPFAEWSSDRSPSGVSGLTGRRRRRQGPRSGNHLGRD